MDISTASQIAIPLVTMASGWSVGRRGLSRQTVDLLQIQVNALKADRDEKAEELAELKSRIETLEGLVTQRAAVEEVKQIVERIADRVGA
jgi:hypothetical protein